ncbi:hypothetical protein [Nonomuraea rubra]|uniref:hypothetical protein n=1 Tax=Nonomuraea rubra TaxID=46180 RepID=UPI0033FA60A8
MDVRWDISYKSLQRFGSPGFFPAGSSLHIEGEVDARGAWNGLLRPRGPKAQQQLVPGSYLELPTGLSDGATLERPGTIRFTPGGLSIKFTPAEGKVMVNSKDPRIQFLGPWQWEYTAPQYDDYLKDVQKTEGLDASAKLEFIGTQVAYIGRREQDLSKIKVKFDGQEVTSGLVEPAKDSDGTDMTGTKTQQVLWTSPADVDYGPHTVEITNTESKLAYLDAFEVITGDVPEPPEHDKASCTLQNDPGSLDVTVPGSTPTGTGTQTPTDDPGTDPPTEDPNDPDPNDPDPNDNEADSGATIGGDFVQVVTPSGTATATATVTPKSTGPTATRYYRAQVANTPSGGVETGVAPDEDRPPFGLMASGITLVMGTAGGGLLLRRRKAAHAGGAQ